jgi:hypothetical protein
VAAAVPATPDLLPVGVCVDVADDLVSFAAHLRQLARTVRTVSHAAPAERAA